MANYSVGKTFGTHGLKGELKVRAFTNHEDLIFRVGSIVIIDDKEYTITKVRVHKNNYLIAFLGYEDINLVNHLRERDILVDKEMLTLDKEDYLLAELIERKDYEKDIYLGNVLNIEEGNNCYYLKVKNNKEFLIPLIDEYVIEVIVNEKKIITDGASSLIF